MDYPTLFSVTYGFSSALLFLIAKFFIIPKMKITSENIEKKVIRTVELLVFHLIVCSFIFKFIGSLQFFEIKTPIIDTILIVAHNIIIWLIITRYIGYDSHPARKPKKVFDIGNVWITGLGAKSIIRFYVFSTIFSFFEIASEGIFLFDKIVALNFLISGGIYGIIWYFEYV